MTKTDSGRRLTELECVTLALVWEHQPCTAYAVRTRLAASPSSHWSGSAGAVYPVLGRLEEAGFVNATAEPRGTRTRRLLEMTAKGQDALRSWLAAGVDLGTASAVYDAVRIRVFFLEALPKAERREFVESALRAVEEHAREVERDVAARSEEGDTFGYLAARGALLTTRARIAWLRELASAIEDTTCEFPLVSR